MTQPIISASILAADFANLGNDANAALSAGANWIHFDVMDHHFVPNLSFGAVVCESLRKAHIDAPIDAHLMVENPENHFEAFAKAGVNLITFHPETTKNVQTALQQCKDLGLQTGLAFNPDKPVDISDDTLQELDMILLMSVFPGFGGQKFIKDVLKKVSTTRERITQINSTCLLGIDGGINHETIGQAFQAGADFFVVGSALFKSDDYKTTIASLRNALNPEG